MWLLTLALWPITLAALIVSIFYSDNDFLFNSFITLEQAIIPFFM